MDWPAIHVAAVWERVPARGDLFATNIISESPGAHLQSTQDVHSLDWLLEKLKPRQHVSNVHNDGACAFGVSRERKGYCLRSIDDAVGCHHFPIKD